MRAAVLKEAGVSVFLMCSDGYASALPFVSSAGRTGEGERQTGREVGLAER